MCGDKDGRGIGGRKEGELNHAEVLTRFFPPYIFFHVYEPITQAYNEDIMHT